MQRTLMQVPRRARDLLPTASLCVLPPCRPDLDPPPLPTPRPAPSSYYVGEKYTLRYTGGMVPDVFQIIVKEKVGSLALH